MTFNPRGLTVTVGYVLLLLVTLRLKIVSTLNLLSAVVGLTALAAMTILPVVAAIRGGVGPQRNATRWLSAIINLF